MSVVSRGLKAFRPSNSIKRIGAVAVPAAAVTIALFLAMRTLIAVEGFSPPDQRIYIIDAYMVPPEAPIPQPITVKPIRIMPAAAPARPPKFIKTLSDSDFQPVSYEGLIPTYQKENIDIVRPKGIGAVVDRGLLPLTPPAPVYPRRAIENGLNGVCEVHMSVSPDGHPFDIDAKCSDPVFRSAAETAVSKVKFAPKVLNGVSVTVTGVVYPIEFRIDQ